MKVKAIMNYFDKQLNRMVEALEEFEVSEDRAKALSTNNNDAMQPLVEIIDESVNKVTTPPEVDTEAKPAKKRGRKKAEDTK